MNQFKGDSMISKMLKIFLLLFFLLLPTNVAFADIGPKPSMEFEFQQETTGEIITIVSGVLHECDQPDCSDAAPLEELGPQRFSCEAQSCYAMAYGFSPYHKLEIQFSDGITRQSNVFETAGFDSKYTVTVRPDDLLVEAQFSLDIVPHTGIAVFLVGCICALAGLGLLAGLVVWFRRRSRTN
jgi:hypothetical protein